MTFSKFLNIPTAILTTALVIPAASFGQTESFTYTDWDNDGNLELTESEVSAGLSDSGTFDAWDRDEEAGLNEGEFATGMFASWDTDNDVQITEEEYTAGTERWYGTDYATPFSDYDTDTSGYIDRTEFGSAWDSSYYTQWDADDDSLLSEEEYGAGVYDSADLDTNQVITVEEEGFFEGWFDGDDVEAEIQEVGDVM
ncbi:hypothetical protein SAMN04488020_10550 [Palleronia marisminoris]|uniref:EF hand n=1 Tax=Palleronia marisminoris TaxID=315423 RepID=A0A1Y5SQ57_9RHOB|nr:hypothetical protein [Palleronia marisminoris]SFG93861.1 hypothetical protein SAMN04488020_10550 [Palleronia marisminoris]SLN45840.1 EF hand [Palleronia marisminoris]